MATASETVPGAGAAGEAAADAAERLAKAAGEAADAAGEAMGIESEGHSSQGDAWSFWFRALMTVVVVIICYAATKVSMDMPAILPLLFLTYLRGHLKN